MTDDERPVDPDPEEEAPATAASDDDAAEFRKEIEEDPSVNPPEELDRLRGG
jgi:hypothetical protein